MPTLASSEFDPSLLQALGLVVVRHAAVEEALRVAIWLEADTAKIVVHVLLSRLNFSDLVDKFGAVYYEHHPSHRELVSALCQQLRSLNDRRNSFMHSFWTVSAGSPDIVRLKLSASPKHGLVTRSEGVAVASVQDLALSLSAAEDKVWEVVGNLSLSPRATDGAG